MINPPYNFSYNILKSDLKMKKDIIKYFYVIQILENNIPNKNINIQFDIKKHYITLIIKKAENVKDVRYPYLRGISTFNLRRIFERSCSKVHAMDLMVTQLEKIRVSADTALKRNLNFILKSISCWTLHYLDSNSVITILHKDQITNLPFWIYCLSNSASYYRGDGGTIIDLCEYRINEFYPCLKQLEIGLISNEKYEQTVPKICFAHKEDKFNYNYTYKEIFNFENIELEILKYIRCHSSENITQDPANSYLDVSLLFTKLGSEEFTYNLKQIQEIIKKYENELNKDARIIIGGCTKIKRQDMFFYFRVNKKTTAWWLERLLGFRGSQGLYPEIMEIKKTLIELDFSLKQLPSPINLNSANMEILGQNETSLEIIRDKFITISIDFKTLIQKLPWGTIQSLLLQQCWMALNVLLP
ncbi:MAG: hypothetical protein H0V82_01290 [Candidatus Protochlamydia sp.]|nr:hypothetical protein [Candidatus Protochlamydia sp.]